MLPDRPPAFYVTGARDESQDAHWLSLDQTGQVSHSEYRSPAHYFGYDPSDSGLCIGFQFGNEWTGRLMLIGAHLAACVQILPEMESVYRWKGQIERQPEILLLAKTARSKFEDLEREVRALHSYETPEIIALPIAAASTAYLDWLTASLKP